MPRQIEMQTTTINGNILSEPINKIKASLLIRAIDQDKFTSLWSDRIPVKQIASELNINTHDVFFLAEYWEIPQRKKAPSRTSKPIDVDQLAERLWDYLKPKFETLIDKRIEEKLG